MLRFHSTRLTDGRLAIFLLFFYFAASAFGQGKEPVIDVIDSNTDYRSAYGGLISEHPVADGYILLFEEYPKPASIVFYDGDKVESIHEAPERAEYTFAGRAGDFLFLTLTYENGVREAYSLNENTLSLTRVADEFADLVRWTELTGIEAGPLSNGKLIWWDDSNLYSSVAPYETSTLLGTYPDGLQQIERTHVRPDGSLLIFTSSGLFFTDGTADGTKVLDARLDGTRLNVHDAAGFSYVVFARAVKVVDASGNLTSVSYDNDDRYLGGSYVAGDSLFFLISSAADTTAFYRVHGSETTATQVDIGQRIGARSVNLGESALTGSRFFHVRIVGDSVVLHSYDRHWRDKRRELSVYRRRSGDGYVGIRQWYEIGDRILFDLGIVEDFQFGNSDRKSNAYLYDEGADVRLRPISPTRVYLSELLHEYEDGDAALVSLVERRFVNSENYAYYLDLVTASLTPMAAKLNAGQYRPEANSRYLSTGGLLYYLENDRQGLFVTVVDHTRAQPVLTYRGFGTKASPPGPPSVMVFPGRLINLGKVNRSESLHTIYHGQEDVEVEENIFGMTLPQFDLRLELLDDILLARTNRGINDFTLRNAGKTLTPVNLPRRLGGYVGKDGERLIFSLPRFPPEIRVYDDKFKLLQLISAIRRTDEVTYNDQLHYYRGRLYFIKRTPVFGSTQTYSLGYRTLEGPEEVILYEETFTSTIGNHPQVSFLNSENRLTFNWPTQRNHFQTTYGFTDGTAAGTEVHSSLDASDDLFVESRLVSNTPFGLLLKAQKERFDFEDTTSHYWLPSNRDMVAVIPPTFLGTGNLTMFSSPIRGTEGDLLYITAEQGKRKGFAYAEKTGEVSFQKIEAEEVVNMLAPYDDDRFLYGLWSDDDTTTVLYLRNIITEATEELVRLPTRYSSYMFGTLLIYRETEGRYLGFYDVEKRVGGRVGVPADLGDELETFTYDIKRGDGFLYGVVNHPEKGTEPYYLQVVDGRIIFGRLYADDNRNDLMDVNERKIAGHPVRLIGSDDEAIAFTDSSGYYAFYATDDQGYTLVVTAPECSSAIFTPATFTVEAGSDEVERDVAFTSSGGALAASVYLTAGRLRCREDVPVWLETVNTGCDVLSGATLTLRLPSNATYASTGTEPNENTDSLVSWTIPELPPLARYRVLVFVTMPNEMFTGNPVDLRAEVTTSDFAVIAETLERPILFCAYDPNDKSVSPLRNDPDGIHPIEREEVLNYTIRFQNTGNDTAFTVRIEDQLSAGLDWTSVHVTSMSHPGVATVDTSGNAVFLFQNIMLPDSNVNEPASHGFVRFNVLPNPVGPDRERLENTAAIYFDANQPIVTNTVHSTVIPFLDEDRDGALYYEDCDDKDPTINPSAGDVIGDGIDQNCDGKDGTTSTILVPALATRVSPNPFSNKITVELPGGEVAEARLYDARGILLRQFFVRGVATIELAELSKGAYLLRLETLDRRSSANHWLIRQ
ncbi:DUF7619 domain-containing protein [Neolewinella antarctica]|uniref:Repeat protein (TIGR01451 family) n=1 Tax=Neolewinella antarctica TaxID=442734 RepID=A0ABX0X8E1_9BACT|nr:MopE-related protein [Neolewinella antarctica]NJC25113.1 putative repeat protein (TIGR01451 family) [Neolewinella antarctica]